MVIGVELHCFGVRMENGRSLDSTFCKKMGSQFNVEESNDSRVDDLTKLEELREVAAIQSAKHQQATRHYHACNISSHRYRFEDFVL
jgi:hypothetical protein